MESDTDAPWRWRGYAADTSSQSFAQFASFLDVWRGKCPDSGVFPRWRDFDLMDFEGWWGQVSLAALLSEPFDVKWVLWGTKITEWWGIDYTNQRMSETALIQEVWQNYERDYFQRLIKHRLIGYVNGTLAPQERDHVYIRGIDLPLEDNGKITHYLTAYQMCDPDDDGVPDVTPVFTI